MAHFFTTRPEQDTAREAAAFILQRVDASQLSEAVVLVPTRRAVVTMRDAFRRLSDGNTVLLPRIFSLADVGDELLALLGLDALEVLTRIPPAMSPARRHYLLSAQVQRFEEARRNRPTLEHSMKLAENLADLQDRCTRAGIALTSESLANLFPGDYAEHWRESVAFLNIVSDIWPLIETEFGQITAAAREVAVLHALRDAWVSNAPSYPVFAVGSTASQPATAALLITIAHLPNGAVILPALDARMDASEWEAVGAGHPYFHLKSLLHEAEATREAVVTLGTPSAAPSIWLQALAGIETMPHWRDRAVPRNSWNHIRVIDCAHAEEEARVIALLMREGLETPEARIALITPDEGLMARVDAQLKRHGLTANRLHHGTLATSEAGSLYIALLETIAAPDAVQPLINLLRHPLVQVGEAAVWQSWLDLFERHARGVAVHSVGQLPALPPVLRASPIYTEVQLCVQAIASAARAQLTPAQWRDQCITVLSPLVQHAGAGHEAVSDALDACDDAEILGRLDSYAFASLLRSALDVPWRAPQFGAHPQLFMLTLVEARLQHFDRVILGNMQESLWPGTRSQSPWLNMAQQTQLGLPGVEEHTALMAHDVLVQGSSREVFLTYPCRAGGSPAARSRFIERLLTLLAAQGVDAREITAKDYKTIALQRDYADSFAPEPAPRPMPRERPEKLAVSALDAMFTDPFSIYARYVLGLKPLDEVDAEPEARDFGSIAHRALQTLGEYWNQHHHAPDDAELQRMTQDALQELAARPMVQLFWQRRLSSALSFVNTQEAARRAHSDAVVRSETSIEQEVALPGGKTIRLHGRIDRLEEQDGHCVIADYKTGAPPSAKDILEGRAVQLLAYAMLMEGQNIPPAALEYWALPSGKRAGVITWLEWDTATHEGLLEQLRAALADLLNPATPLLARPIPTNERFANDYDGISRYDEWAG